MRQSVEGKLDARFEDLGQQGVKNISRPVHVFRIVPERNPADAAVPLARGRSRRLSWVLALGIATVLTAGAVIAWSMLGTGSLDGATTGCTDHLGLPVPAERCAELRE